MPSAFNGDHADVSRVQVFSHVLSLDSHALKALTGVILESDVPFLLPLYPLLPAPMLPPSNCVKT